MNVERLRAETAAETPDAQQQFIVVPIPQPVPFQPLRGIIEPDTDEDGDYWRYRIFNATTGNLPQWRYTHEDINHIIACADTLKTSGGIDYTITGLPQRDE